MKKLEAVIFFSVVFGVIYFGMNVLIAINSVPYGSIIGN